MLTRTARSVQSSSQSISSSGKVRLCGWDQNLPIRSASRPGDCLSAVRVIMIGRTLARPTERVDLGQQRKVWRWSSE
jgi:hypothetical protein